MEDHIIASFCRIDDVMKDVPAHPQTRLGPGEIVTLAVLFAIKGVSGRAFHRWLAGNWQHLFPQLPERTRLFRLFTTHQDWVDRFPFEEQMIVLTDNGFHGAQGDPPNMKVCQPRTWGCRMLVETVLSMVTGGCKIKHMRHRAWDCFRMHLAWTVAALNLMLDCAADRSRENDRPALSVADYML